MLDRSSIMEYPIRMNKKSDKERAKMVQLLCEGNSMRSTSRIMDCSINTVTKLLVDMGKACERYHDQNHRNLPSRYLEVDELFSYVGIRPINMKEEIKDKGDIWVWSALDQDSRFVVTWWVGRRDKEAAVGFMDDLRLRVVERPHIVSDGLRSYNEAIDISYDKQVDFAQLIKHYTKVGGKERYSGYHKERIWGNPDPDRITTAHIERMHLTLRMGCRRFGRRTNAFSKKLENHCYALALHFFHYNYCRILKTLRITPAMALGITDHVWEIEELVALLDLPPE